MVIDMTDTKYCEEDDVYLATGITKEVIERVTEKTDDQVKDMVESFIIDAEDDIRDQLGIPHVAALEKHLGTGEDDEFQLGQEDSDFFTNIDVENCVVLIKTCFFEGFKRNCLILKIVTSFQKIIRSMTQLFIVNQQKNQLSRKLENIR